MTEKRQFIRLRRASDLDYSLPIVKKEITLYSGDAQSLLRHYNFTAAALYQLGITLRKWTTEDKVQELQKHVFDELIAPLEAELTKTEAKYKNIPVPDAVAEKVIFTKPFTDTVEISYPGALQLLDILVKFDQLLVQLAKLWYARKIDDHEYARVGTACRHRLKDDEKRIERLVREAVNLARLQAEARQLGEEEKPAEEAGRGRSRKRRLAEAEQDQEALAAKPMASDDETSAYSPFEQLQ